MTIIGAWNDDDFPAYLRHFFYTIQLNADVLDLVMINRLREPNSTRLDFFLWPSQLTAVNLDDEAFRLCMEKIPVYEDC